MGQLVNFLREEGDKYINFRAKSKFFMVIYKLVPSLAKGHS